MKIKNLLILASALLFCTTACSKLFGGLRRDLDDNSSNSVSGGVWPERGMLDDSDLRTPSVYDDYNSVGHSERASNGYQPTDQNQTWLGRPNSEQYNQPTVQEANAQLAQAQAARSQRGPASVRMKRSDFWDDSQNDGSLWASGGQTNYFFTKNSVKSPGDIISVNVQDQFVKDVAAELKRTLTEDEQDAEVDQLRDKRQRQIASISDAQQSAAAGPNGAAAPDAAAAAASNQDLSDPSKLTFADVDLSKSIGLKNGDTIMAEILERYPSGNYKIRGTKRVSYHGTQRLLTFVGIARANDVTEKDTMDSGKLYEYRLNVQNQQ